jgi:integrase
VTDVDSQSIRRKPVLNGLINEYVRAALLRIPAGQLPNPILGRDKIVEGKPKTKTSARKVWLDAETVRLLREHHETQLAARLRAGDAWQDNDLVFCKDDGSPWPPDYVYRRFRALAKTAGVPVIKLHEGGRHTSASLARDAEVDPEIRRKTLGHADQAMTSHYTHIEAQAHRAAAEAVARLVDVADSDNRSMP